MRHHHPPGEPNKARPARGGTGRVTFQLYSGPKAGVCPTLGLLSREPPGATLTPRQSSQEEEQVQPQGLQPLKVASLSLLSPLPLCRLLCFLRPSCPSLFSSLPVFFLLSTPLLSSSSVVFSPFFLLLFLCPTYFSSEKPVLNQNSMF